MPLFLAAMVFAASSWIHVPGGTWNPTPEMIIETGAKLRPYVVAQAALQGRKLQPWATYTFQYQGQAKAFKLPTQVLSKRRIILVNAFCITPPSYVYKELVTVLDGGTCFFRAYYDTVQHRFIYIVFNGVA